MDVVNKNRRYKSETILLLQTLVPVITSKTWLCSGKTVSASSLFLMSMTGNSRLSWVCAEVKRCLLFKPVDNRTLNLAFKNSGRLLPETSKEIVLLNAVCVSGAAVALDATSLRANAQMGPWPRKQELHAFWTKGKLHANHNSEVWTYTYFNTLRDADAKLWTCTGWTPEIAPIGCFQLAFQLFKR